MEAPGNAPEGAVPPLPAAGGRTASARLRLGDLPYFFYRRNDEWSLDSERHFHAKWNSAFSDGVARRRRQRALARTARRPAA